ncbi:MAG: RNA polymerase sigma factor [Lentisphaeraceae bacterium]|nr:RNA polymerase sigma factor [Lentisphaeraceae bacterium]
MSENWQTRQTLLQRAKNPDDHKAWEDFEQYYREFIRMVLFQMNCRVNDHADLVQDILVKIWKTLPELNYDRDRARFRTWLSHLIRNKVIDYFRKEKRISKKQERVQEESEVDKASKIVSEPELENIIRKEWEVYIVKLALQNISSLFTDRAIEAFQLGMDGVKTVDIAAKIGIKENSVIKLRNRVKQRLIKEIQHLREELESV